MTVSLGKLKITPSKSKIRILSQTWHLLFLLLLRHNLWCEYAELSVDDLLSMEQLPPELLLFDQLPAAAQSLQFTEQSARSVFSWCNSWTSFSDKNQQSTLKGREIETLMSVLSQHPDPISPHQVQLEHRRQQEITTHKVKLKGKLY